MTLRRELLRLFAPGAAAKRDDAEALAKYVSAIQSSALAPEYQAALIDRGRLGQEPAEAIAYANQIRDMCFAASRMTGNRSLEVGPSSIRANISPKDLGHSLIAQIADEDEAVQIVTTVPPTVTKRDKQGNPYEAAPSPQADAQAKRLDPREIYDGINGRNRKPEPKKRSR